MNIIRQKQMKMKISKLSGQNVSHNYIDIQT